MWGQSPNQSAKPLSKNLRYRIRDNFYLFWFRFIAKHSAAVELGSFGLLREIVRRDWNAFSGFALERYFTAKLSETGLYTCIGGWWDRKGENEIDLIHHGQSTLPPHRDRMDTTLL